MEKIKCPHCGKEYCKNGIKTHIWKSHGEGKDHDPNRGYKDGSRIVWNKGLTKYTDERVRAYGEKNTGREPYNKGRKHTEESRRKMSISAKKAFDKGIHANWKSRKERSYPERYFEKVLDTLGIFDQYETEYPIKNGKYQYFLDFYFPDKKVNLEIDGEQHRLKDRIESDKRRDRFLMSEGIKVFRIDWKNPKTSEGREYLEEKIKEFALLV